jgi:uncharacterized membrane protein
MATAFLGSLVEFIEALTIVLAVGTVRGWRSAMLGTSMGVLLRWCSSFCSAPRLGLIPITPLQLGVGVLLVLFDMRWLRKAILRAAGTPLHDEAKAYASELEAMRRDGRVMSVRWDSMRSPRFKAVVLEGLEVVFIVVAVGAVGQMLSLP